MGGRLIRTLRGKLIAANVAVFLVAMAVFGAVQVSMSSRSAERLLDDAMLARARDMARGPRPGGPPGPQPDNQRGPDGPPPDGPPNGVGDGTLGNQGPPGQNRPPFRMADRFHPSVLRRPGFVLADGRIFPVSENRPVWSPALLEISKSGKVARGYENAFNMRVRVVSMPIPAPNGQFDVVQVAEDASAIDLARRSQLLSLASVLPFALVAALAAAWLLARFVIEPVSSISRWAVKLAGDPDAPDRIPRQSTAEMNSLAESVNSMTDGMQAANVKIRDSLERQRQFSSDAAHELRTPLTSLRLAAENGLHQDAGPEEMRKSLQVVQRSAASLGGLLEMLLSLSRLDSSGAQLELEEVSLEVVAAAAIDAAGLAGDGRLRMNLHAPTVWANSGAVKQILVNLLTNAANHTAPDGEIGIESYDRTLCVSDTGAGIADEHIEKVFDRFYRVDESRNRSQGGYGLGLAIVRSLVDAQGAKVFLESSQGVGSKFFVEFAERPENS